VFSMCRQEVMHLSLALPEETRCDGLAKICLSAVTRSKIGILLLDHRIYSGEDDAEGTLNRSASSAPLGSAL